MYRTLRLWSGFQDEDEARDVKFLQKHLAIKEDGLFGKQTEKAVIDFQTKNGLDVDGIAGQETWRALIPSLSMYPDKYPPDSPTLSAHLLASEAYQEIIVEASNRYDVPIDTIWAIGSRETGWGTDIKTQEHNIGIMGIPIYEIMKATPIEIPRDELLKTLKKPMENIFTAVSVFKEIHNNLNNKRYAIAAYSAGVKNVKRSIQKGKDVDFYAAGKDRDYSTDVLNRAKWYRLKHAET